MAGNALGISYNDYEGGTILEHHSQRQWFKPINTIDNTSFLGINLKGFLQIKCELHW